MDLGFQTNVMKTTNPCMQLKIDAAKSQAFPIENERISIIQGTPMMTDKRTYKRNLKEIIVDTANEIFLDELTSFDSHYNCPVLNGFYWYCSYTP